MQNVIKLSSDLQVKENFTFIMSDKSLRKILQDFSDGVCLFVDEALLKDRGMLEGKMTKAATSVLLLIAFSAVFINFGVIFRVYKLLKKEHDVKPAFFFIGNLAISDFLVGLYVIIVFCIDLSKSFSTWKNNCCGFLTAMVVTACQETICSIVLIAIDKYIFICHGLTYRVKVTRKRVYIVIALSWCCSLLIGFLPSIGMHEKKWCTCNFALYISTGFAVIMFLTSVAIPLLIIISLYSVILSLAIKMTKSRLKETRSNSSGVSTTVVRLSFSSKSSRATSRSTSKASSIVVVSRSLARASKASIIKKSSSGAGRGLAKDRSARNAKEEEATVVTDSIAGTSANSDCKFEATSKPSSRRLSSKSHLKGSESGTFAEKEVLSPGKQFLNEDEVLESQPMTPMEHIDGVDSALHFMPRRDECSHQKEEIDSVEEKMPVKNEQQRNENCEDRRNSTDFSFSEQDLKSKNYFKNIFLETKDKVQFLQKCKAIKAIGLIVILFVVTYAPFVLGTFAYKLKAEPDERLFSALNNLLYCAVVLNSVFNPFVYAYGYKEFRIKTKRFIGIFARRS